MMKREEIEQKIKKIISKALSINESNIKTEAALVEDLGADSLNSVEISMTLEEEFDIEIPDEDITKMATVENIVNYVSQKINK